MSGAGSDRGVACNPEGFQTSVFSRFRETLVSRVVMIKPAWPRTDVKAGCVSLCDGKAPALCPAMSPRGQPACSRSRRTVGLAIS